MTYPDAIQFLYDLRMFGTKLGLENTFKLAALAGNPQRRLRFIHVAGTNGKGSTCAMLESIYRAAGLRVGLFTSPHLVSFRERIQVNRQLISEGDVVRLVEGMREQCRTGVAPVSIQHHSDQKTEEGDRRDASPTFFEFVTVMALKYFAEQKCDLVIWETGLGGRLDATNIVTPLASVITNVALDHQQWLGDTLEKIAVEKAGIIKPGVPVLTASQEPAVFRIIETTARLRAAPFVNLGLAFRLVGTGAAPRLALIGDHQSVNATLAMATVQSLQDKIPVSKEAVRRGLETVEWPGRFQVVKRGDQNLLLDGAHNPASAETLRAAFQKNFPDAKPALVLGILRDKDFASMCQVLAPLSERIFTVPVSSERTASAEELRSLCQSANSSARVVACSSLAEALQQTANDSLVVITGSLYLVGEALQLLQAAEETVFDERALNEWAQRK